MSFFALSALINAIVSTLLGFFVFKRNSKEKVNVIFAIFCASVALWSYGYYLWQIADNAADAYFWTRFLMMGAILIPITYLHFILVLLNLTQKRKLFLWVSYAFFIFFLVANIFTTGIVSHVEPLLTFRFWPIAGSLFDIFLTGWIGYAVYVAWLLLREIFRTAGMERLKIIYILIGTVIGYGGGITNFFLWYRIPVLPVGNISTVFYLGIVAYAIVKFRLMNIQVLATQVLAAGITLITFIEIFNVGSVNEFILRSVIFIITATFAILIVRSVLKEVRRREQIEKLAAALAEANKRRARANKELEKANLRLKKLDAAKSEFLSIASHQLRTPLTAVKGYGSMILEGDFGDVPAGKVREAIEKIVVSNDRLISLVETLLNVSRIESGRLRFAFKEQQLETLVEDVAGTLQTSAQNAGLYLKIQRPASSAGRPASSAGRPASSAGRPDKPLPAVYMDEEKIRQVVINFIDNAIKYTEKGGITIKLFAKSGFVVCKVEDTGMGVSPDEQQRLFQKFTRGKDAFTVNTEGTGLGLYVAQMMVKSHQGKIWIESEGEGKGSKFCFSLPALTSPAGKKFKIAADKLMAEAGQAEAEKKGKKAGLPAQALLPAGNQASGQKQSVAGR